MIDEEEEAAAKVVGGMLAGRPPWCRRCGRRVESMTVTTDSESLWILGESEPLRRLTGKVADVVVKCHSEAQRFRTWPPPEVF